jgi:hypothetical protein
MTYAVVGVPVSAPFFHSSSQQQPKIEMRFTPLVVFE